MSKRIFITGTATGFGHDAARELAARGHTVATAGGETSLDGLGRTLMHEHLTIGYPGWESHTTIRRRTPREMLSICIDRVQELQGLGYTTMVDPCPGDLGRDPELAAAVAQHTGFQIIIATGLYKESEGGLPYWHFRSGLGGDASGAMAEVFVHELTEGIGQTEIRAGIIKVASGPGRITDYERQVLHAAAIASTATGAPITTHTEQGTMGEEQQRILVNHGVPPQRILIGHSCGTSDHRYHMGIANGGSYLGFDQFGLPFFPDDRRVAALAKMIRAGAGDRVVVSHDSVWCWKGAPFPPEALGEMPDATLFDRKIAPELLKAGVAESEIERLVVDNPQRFFDAEPLPTLQEAI